MTLADSRTKENLMKAFAGESQARNRYTFAAELAQQNGLYVIKKVFDLTAYQEQHHAEVFYKLLSEMDGQEIRVPEADYPVNTAQNVEQQLLNAMENEAREADEIYRTFGDIALEEGFQQISGKFYMIADVERIHQQRFETFYQWMKEGKLFVSDVKTGWVCLNCGYVIEATNAPQNCPACDASQGYFVRLSMSPYYESGMGEDKNRDLGK
ncbi:MAG: rubrerythrin family protein [Eubacteriales bacterium]|nr:rubrerythrin family protein [Eubacteriales bacterium]